MFDAIDCLCVWLNRKWTYDWPQATGLDVVMLLVNKELFGIERDMDAAAENSRRCVMRNMESLVCYALFQRLDLLNHMFSFLVDP